MSLTTYEETRPWASAMRKEVVAKRMPPFHATGPIGHWKNDQRLTEGEIETIVDWVAQGAIRGNPADRPPPREWPESSWQFGEPDQVLEFPSHNVSTNGIDEYVYLFSDFVFPEDMWVRAVSINAEHFDALHHLNVFVVPPDFDVPNGNKATKKMFILGHQTLGSWFPGMQTALPPENQGMLVKKGSRIALETHFAPRTNPLEEDVRLGIHWANGVIDRLTAQVGVMMHAIEIPPHESNYTFRETVTFQEDAWITHFRVHMHLRGKSAHFTLHYPDGTSESIFDLPQYHFDWQRHYHLASPRHVPKGTELEIVATWDNSAKNPLNPDPSSTVRWGMNTTDEMFGGNIFYMPAKKLDTPVRVQNGREIPEDSD